MHLLSNLSPPPLAAIAVTVWKDDTIIGHVPQEISRVFSPKEQQRDDLSSRRQQMTIGGGERTSCFVCVR
ncbi:MAG: hypothetical protein MJE68_12975, partial [Proteobacteria bacterium]|nr:hypothetical protein [Pseudomonadota bacterium]